MEKLFLLLKSKRNLKRQLLLLVLAATAMIAVGCTPSETPIADDTESGFEDVIDSNDYAAEEAMTPINVENLDAEAEILTNLLTEKGIDVGFEDVRATLLHLNKESFTDDDYYALFEVNEDEKEKVTSVLNAVLRHNDASVRNEKAGDIVNFKIFCRNAKEYRIIEKFDYEISLVAKTIVDNPKSLDSEIRTQLEPLYNFLDIKQIAIGGETFKFEELNDGTKILIDNFGLQVRNYVNYSCDSEYVTDETKEFCETIGDLSSILSKKSWHTLRDNTSKQH